LNRIILGITGASGVIYGIRLLEAFHELNIETDLVISDWALETLRTETDDAPERLRALATRNYGCHDLAAAISSGSTRTDGMVVAPCSMKTLAGIANGFCGNLIERAADVTLKERRKLILAVRETPLSPIHLENMLKLARLGVVIMPPVPGFYTRPRSIADLIDFQTGKILDQLGINHCLYQRWDGEADAKSAQI
jgi:4-hydroxy-3-polyprenylbenzoate decarboxylase